MNFCSRIYNQSTIDYFLAERNGIQHAKHSPRKSGDLKASTKDWVAKSFYSSPTVIPGGKKSASVVPIPTTNDQTKKTPSKNIPDYKGEPAIYFEQSVITSNAEKFKFCLVGKFKRSRPNLEKIREWVSKEWKPTGEWSVTLLDQTHVFVRLDNENDMMRIWPRNRWFIQGHLMKVFKWAPTFRPSDGEPNSSAVWISLPLLPVLFFQQELLYSIASLVGRVIGMDGPTRSLSRTNVARVCVEVDLLRELPKRVWIGTGEGGFWQDIRYQKLPSYCTGCRQQGHSLGICKFTKRDAASCVSLDNSNFQTRGDEKKHLVAEASSQPSKKLCSVVEKEEKGKEVTEEKGECSIAQATEQILSAKRPNTVLGLSRKQGITEESGVDASVNAQDYQGIGTEKVVSEEKVHARGKGLFEKVAVEVEEHANELGKEEFEISSQDEQKQPEKQSRKPLKNKSDGRSLLKRSPHARKNILLNTNLFFWKRRDEKPSWLPLDNCRHFSLAELKQCTRNFAASLVIGRGGYGNVYKGFFADGTIVAIKKLSQYSGQGKRQFQAEILPLSKLRHRNVVSLLGFCQEQNEMILVYEFIGNGCLKDHLCNSNSPLSWKQRLEICIGVARGLHYVHTSSIIHRDVKTCNILIDKNWDAKLGDFGLSKMVPDVDDTFTHFTTCIQGTMGYLDPEYIRAGHLTYKTDVYSFGVVLFEVLSGRPAVVDVGGRRMSITELALQCKKSGNLEEIVDPFLKGQFNPKCLLKFMETAEKCVSDRGVDRPDMRGVLWNLEYALKLQEITIEEGGNNNSSGFTKDTEGSFRSSPQALPLQGSDTSWYDHSY